MGTSGNHATFASVHIFSIVDYTLDMPIKKEGERHKARGAANEKPLNIQARILKKFADLLLGYLNGPQNNDATTVKSPDARVITLTPAELLTCLPSLTFAIEYLQTAHDARVASAEKPEANAETLRETTAETLRESTAAETLRETTAAETLRESTAAETLRETTAAETLRKATEVFFKRKKIHNNIGTFRAFFPALEAKPVLKTLTGMPIPNVSLPLKEERFAALALPLYLLLFKYGKVQVPSVDTWDGLLSLARLKSLLESLKLLNPTVLMPPELTKSPVPPSDFVPSFASSDELYTTALSPSFMTDLKKLFPGKADDLYDTAIKQAIPESTADLNEDFWNRFLNLEVAAARKAQEATEVDARAAATKAEATEVAARAAAEAEATTAEASEVDARAAAEAAERDMFRLILSKVSDEDVLSHYYSALSSTLAAQEPTNFKDWFETHSDTLLPRVDPDSPSYEKRDEVLIKLYGLTPSPPAESQAASQAVAPDEELGIEILEALGSKNSKDLKRQLNAPAWLDVANRIGTLDRIEMFVCEASSGTEKTLEDLLASYTLDDVDFDVTRSNAWKVLDMSERVSVLQNKPSDTTKAEVGQPNSATPNSATSKPPPAPAASPPNYLALKFALLNIDNFFKKLDEIPRPSDPISDTDDPISDTDDPIPVPADPIPDTAALLRKLIELFNYLPSTNQTPAAPYNPALSDRDDLLTGLQIFEQVSNLANLNSSEYTTDSWLSEFLNERKLTGTIVPRRSTFTTFVQGLKDPEKRETGEILIGKLKRNFWDIYVREHNYLKQLRNLQTTKHNELVSNYANLLLTELEEPQRVREKNRYDILQVPSERTTKRVNMLDISPNTDLISALQQLKTYLVETPNLDNAKLNDYLSKIPSLRNSFYAVCALDSQGFKLKKKGDQLFSIYVIKGSSTDDIDFFFSRGGSYKRDAHSLAIGVGNFANITDGSYVPVFASVSHTSKVAIRTQRIMSPERRIAVYSPYKIAHTRDVVLDPKEVLAESEIETAVGLNRSPALKFVKEERVGVDLLDLRNAYKTMDEDTLKKTDDYVKTMALIGLYNSREYIQLLKTISDNNVSDPALSTKAKEKYATYALFYCAAHQNDTAASENSFQSFLQGNKPEAVTPQDGVNRDVVDKCNELMETKLGYMISQLIPIEITKVVTAQNLLQESLHEYLHRPEPNWEEISDYARQIVDAVLDFHKLGYVHGDIKPKNLMFELLFTKKDGTQKNQIKLIDFGTSRSLQDTEKLRDIIVKKESTPHNIAPWVWTNKNQEQQLTKKEDLYQTLVLISGLSHGETVKAIGTARNKNPQQVTPLVEYKFGNETFCEMTTDDENPVGLGLYRKLETKLVESQSDEAVVQAKQAFDECFKNYNQLTADLLYDAVSKASIALKPTQSVDNEVYKDLLAINPDLRRLSWLNNTQIPQVNVLVATKKKRELYLEHIKTHRVESALQYGRIPLIDITNDSTCTNDIYRLLNENVDPYVIYCVFRNFILRLENHHLLLNLMRVAQLKQVTNIKDEIVTFTSVETFTNILLKDCKLLLSYANEDNKKTFANSIICNLPSFHNLFNCLLHNTSNQ